MKNLKAKRKDYRNIIILFFSVEKQKEKNFQFVEILSMHVRYNKKNHKIL
jgi:hypothetical protein